MTPSEALEHVFVVRIWRVPHARAGELPELRGRVEHFPGEEWRPLRDLDDITAFVRRHVGSMGRRRRTWTQLFRSLGYGRP